MTISIKGIEREATVVSLPKHTLTIDNYYPHPLFPAMCAVSSSVEEDGKSGRVAHSELITAPLTRTGKGRVQSNVSTVYSEVNTYVISFLCRVAKELDLNVEDVICESLELFLLHGTPIPTSEREQIANIVPSIMIAKWLADKCEED